MNIKYTIGFSGDATIGHMIIATYDGKICFLAFGSSGDQLESDLSSRFPQATLEFDYDDELHEKTAKYITTGDWRLAIDFDQFAFIGASSFQQQVWKALQEIPRGTTFSYKELAETIGKPKAYRAVARACSQNPIALYIPCHRVIGSNNKLTGYRWGIERKKRLLEIERA